MKRNFIFTAALLIMTAVTLMRCSTLPKEQPSILSYLPDPGKAELEGWQPTGTPKMFAGKDLYLYMNGGADIYHSYGFQQLIAQEYVGSQNKKISLEIFEMQSTSSASKIYSFKTGDGGKAVKVGKAGLLEDYYMNFWRGNFLITLTGFDSDMETIDGLLSIAAAVDEKIITLVQH